MIYTVNVNNGNVEKVFDFEKLGKLVRAGFFVTKSYLDAVTYSRAVLMRGTDNYGKKAVYFNNNY